MKQSAGFLLYSWNKGKLEVLLCHPGGPFYIKKDYGVWSIPKGEYDPQKDTDLLQTALREVKEELNADILSELYFEPLPMVEVSGKQLYCWVVELSLDTSMMKSNTFELEWPPKSGRIQQFPEMDQFMYRPINEAMHRITSYQKPLLEELARKLNVGLTEVGIGLFG